MTSENRNELIRLGVIGVDETTTKPAMTMLGIARQLSLNNVEWVKQRSENGESILRVYDSQDDCVLVIEPRDGKIAYYFVDLFGEMRLTRYYDFISIHEMLDDFDRFILTLHRYRHVSHLNPYFLGGST